MSRNIGEQGSNGGPRRAYGLQFDDPVKRVSCSSIDEFFRDSDYDQDKVREIQKIHEKARMERIRRKIEDAEEKGKRALADHLRLQRQSSFEFLSDVMRDIDKFEKKCPEYKEILKKH